MIRLLALLFLLAFVATRRRKSVPQPVDWREYEPVTFA